MKCERKTNLNYGADLHDIMGNSHYDGHSTSNRRKSKGLGLMRKMTMKLSSKANKTGEESFSESSAGMSTKSKTKKIKK